MKISLFILTVFSAFLFRDTRAAETKNLGVSGHGAYSDSLQGNFDPFNCEGTRRRKEIRKLTPTEVKEWQDAVLELINERDTEPLGFWDSLVRLHQTYAREAHGGSYFLPWHRLFLLVLENEIRARGRPNFALPYWDWSVDANDAALSDIWDASLVGGANSASGRGRGRPIPNGAFKNIKARFGRPHKVLRNFTSGSPGSIFQFLSKDGLDMIIESDTFETFAISTEVAHGIVHVGIGGDMLSTRTSPNDPVFYLHHAFVDYIYSRRQKLFGADDFGGIHFFGNKPRKAKANFVFRAFDLPVRDGFSTPCVEYVPYKNVPSPSPYPQNQSPLPSPEPDMTVLTDACKNKDMRMEISEKVCVGEMKKLMSRR